MDLITMFMNLVGVPTLFTTLFSMLPPFYFFKLTLSFLSNLFPEDVRHKVVLITGASSGIGEQLAYEYARRGAALSLVARREASLREVAEHMGLRKSLLFLPMSLNMKIVTVLSRPQSTILADDVNFWGTVLPTHVAIPHLKRTKGKILLNASAGSWNPYPKMSFYNAANAAAFNFFETLRIELGDAVGITIATPGWIESEMTKGKHISRLGNVEVDQDIRDAQIGMMPVMHAEKAAKEMVDAVCRGDRYITFPTWFRVIFLWRVFAPEVVEWIYRKIYMTRPGAPPTDAASKKMLDVSGAKNVLYPSSLQSPEIKND